MGLDGVRLCAREGVVESRRIVSHIARTAGVTRHHLQYRRWSHNLHRHVLQAVAIARRALW
jgi:DNA-binding phage protein